MYRDIHVCLCVSVISTYVFTHSKRILTYVEMSVKSRKSKKSFCFCFIQSSCINVYWIILQMNLVFFFFHFVYFFLLYAYHLMKFFFCKTFNFWGKAIFSIIFKILSNFQTSICKCTMEYILKLYIPSKVSFVSELKSSISVLSFMSFIFK